MKDPDGLFYSSPQKLDELGVETKMKHEIISVDTDRKTLKVRNLATEDTFEDTYDKLIVTTGSWPIVPKLEGIDLNNILLCKTTIIPTRSLIKRKERNILRLSAPVTSAWSWWRPSSRTASR